MNSVDVWLKGARSAIAAALWPARCVLCTQAGRADAIDLCGSCEADLPFNRERCRCCSAPLQQGSRRDRLCGHCVRKPPCFDTSFIPFRFAYPIDHMVRRLKYAGALANGRVLGELFARQLPVVPSEELPELLLPVPLAHGRFRERGFNQSIVLAEHIHRAVGVAVRADLLVRTRETSVQAGLDQRARRRNIHRAFELSDALPATRVAILDDVVTTGSTVDEIARVLKRAGAQRVDVWAVARA